MAEFKDHFSSQSKDYSTYRPHYPQALYQYLSHISVGHELAWDCATGTGQAARGLSPFFQAIIATEGSEAQLGQASGPQNINFRLATAEKSGLDPKTVDLITVAQALHWFDQDLFFEEARRVLKPQGIIAVWSYNLLQINQSLNDMLRNFSEETVGPFWPPERQLVNGSYRTIKLPFHRLRHAAAQPVFSMTAEWSLADLMGYLATWSAVERYKAVKGDDPLKMLFPHLKAGWGEPEELKKISWPLTVKIGQA